MGQKKTIRQEDIARELKISTVSVSNALKGSPGVSKELRLKIQKKAQELGYEYCPPTVKRETKHYSIGVVIAEKYVKQFPSYYMDIYKHVAQAAGRKGNVTILKVVDAEREDLTDPGCLFENLGVEGIIIIGEMQKSFLERLRKMPVVCVDFYSMAEDIDYIVPDNLHGMQKVTEFLIKAGHRDIAFWGDPLTSCCTMDRYMGYCKALKKNGISDRNRAAAFRQSRQSPDGEAVLPGKLPSAFVCGSGQSAFHLIGKLRERKLSVPGDISVAGFGHTGIQNKEGIFLTTYETDEKALAEISVNTLLKRISGTNPPEKSAKGIQMVQGRLVKGNTVKSGGYYE